MPIRLFTRHVLLFSILFFYGSRVRASEGFWLPHLLKDNVEEHMQQLGLKLTAEDIYRVNQSSLKDAIVNFGGCTGSIISPEGLLLTNHHCGYGRIVSHSTPENNLLKNGFWAMNHAEEIPNPGLAVSFIKRIENVTARVLDQIDTAETEAQRELAIEKAIKAIEAEAQDGNHYQASVRSFYYGNEYILFISEVYNDVRLVAAPPAAIGKFGGDTDNWMWPRHTGDFSLFRIYTAPDGSPAEYSEDNVPMASPNHLRITTEGVQQGDFTMVFGFPGRSSQYLTSHAVDFLVNTLNPARIALRREKLELIDATMSMNDTLQLLYAARQAGIANYYKKWMGENMGLKRFNAVNRKKQLEERFFRYAADNDINAEDMFEQFASANEAFNQQQLIYAYVSEALDGVYAIRLAGLFADRFYFDDTRRTNEYLLERQQDYYKINHLPTDKNLFLKMVSMYREGLDQAHWPEALKIIDEQFDGSVEAYTDYIFSGSILLDQGKLTKLFTKKEEKIIQVIQDDPLAKLARDISLLRETSIIPAYFAANDWLTELYQSYVVYLQNMMPEKAFYPDANSTLRLSYGQVEGSMPHDGLAYLPFTTLEGIMQKEDANNPDFVLPVKLKKLYQEKNYGMYANQDGELPVCFLASNHTTGGNSGSPVINGEGELIGLNFDRSWESTMSDVMYNEEICRNISVDIRYILFLIEKLGEAEWLVDEMQIARTLPIE